jgi:hypothetical protein
MMGPERNDQSLEGIDSAAMAALAAYTLPTTRHRGESNV